MVLVRDQRPCFGEVRPVLRFLIDFARCETSGLESAPGTESRTGVHTGLGPGRPVRSLFNRISIVPIISWSAPHLYLYENVSIPGTVQRCIETLNEEEDAKCVQVLEATRTNIHVTSHMGKKQLITVCQPTRQAHQQPTNSYSHYFWGNPIPRLNTYLSS